MDILKLINKKDVLDFSQNFSVQRNYLGDKLFPDVKTQHLKAEFYRLTDNRMLPTMAMVHAFDTEAHIGTRPTAEKVKLEKMLIKEKINQSERVQLFLENGADENSVVKYIFDDIARLSEAVKTRTEVMKCDVLQSGKLLVRENNVSFTVDYAVPAANKTSLDLSSNDNDVLAAIQKMVDDARDAGQNITQVITTSAVLTKLRQNTAVQKAIAGVNNVGTFVSSGQLSALMQDMFGFTLTTYDARYQYEKANGSFVSERYIAEDKFIGISTLANNTVGVGLWGATPEELAQGAWTAKNASQFVTSVMWEEQDPVAVWTKASGLFIPVLPNPSGLFIATCKLK